MSDVCQKFCSGNLFEPCAGARTVPRVELSEIRSWARCRTIFANDAEDSAKDRTFAILQDRRENRSVAQPCFLWWHVKKGPGCGKDTTLPSQEYSDVVTNANRLHCQKNMRAWVTAVAILGSYCCASALSYLPNNLILIKDSFRQERRQGAACADLHAQTSVLYLQPSFLTTITKPVSFFLKALVYLRKKLFGCFLSR